MKKNQLFGLKTQPFYGARLWALFSALMAVSQVNAQSTLVTIAEDPTQTTSSLSNTDVFDFNDLALGINNNVNWAGVGTFDTLEIANPNVWGGALDLTTGEASQFSWQRNKTINTSTLFLDTPSSYFGFWWSAGDYNNQLSFYSGDQLLSQYTTASMFGSLNLSSDYYGNPLTGGNTREPYAFINFYGDENTAWDRIELKQVAGGGFESDNYTTRVEAFNPEVDAEDSLGLVVAEVTGTDISIVESPSVDWVWGFEEKAPGAPIPPALALALFAMIFLFKKGFSADENTEK
ncbi:MAG: hypothetical protein AAFX93_18475 [Verrucomicrobiota bacterium]